MNTPHCPTCTCPDGVKTAVRRMRARLGARDRAHAVAIGYRTGLLRRPS